MALDPIKVRDAIRSGLSSVCASCRHFWEAQDRGLSSCGKECGGPLVGKDFPLYEGPMDRLDKFCFACTSESSFAIKSFDSARLVGVCSKHLRLLDTLKADDLGQSRVEVVSSKGILVPIGGRYTPKSLGEVVAETESAWRDDHGE